MTQLVVTWYNTLLADWSMKEIFAHDTLITLSPELPSCILLKHKHSNCRDIQTAVIFYIASFIQ